VRPGAGSFLATFISLCTYIRATTTLFQRHSLHICSQKNALTDGRVVNEIQTEIFANPYHMHTRIRGFISDARTDGWVVNEIQTEIFANPYAHTNPPSLSAAPSQLLEDVLHG
jgi:hypothetical protein